MTKKAIEWWKSFTFWDKVRAIIGFLGIGSEVTLFLVESYPYWKIVAAIATTISFVITFFFKDIDGDGIVDVFENE